jgi:hypothetical protein
MTPDKKSLILPILLIARNPAIPVPPWFVDPAKPE